MRSCVVLDHAIICQQNGVCLSARGRWRESPSGLGFRPAWRGQPMSVVETVEKECTPAASRGILCGAYNERRSRIRCEFSNWYETPFEWQKVWALGWCQWNDTDWGVQRVVAINDGGFVKSFTNNIDNLMSIAIQGDFLLVCLDCAWRAGRRYF